METKQLIPIVVCLFVLYSCSDNKNTQGSVKSANTVYQVIDVDCWDDWKNSVCYDTSFQEGVHLKLTSHCQDIVSFIDTIQTQTDTCLIRKWKDIEFTLQYSILHQTITINKNSFAGSLALDLKENGFMTPPDDLLFSPRDSSIVLKFFIGHAESDVGDVYVMLIDKHGKTDIVAIEPSDMDEVIE